MDNDPEYGWGYFYLVMAECRAEHPIALANYVAVPNGLLVCEKEPEMWHKARRSYRRAQHFADESLKKTFAFMEDVNKSLLLCKQAEENLEKKKYETVIFSCAKMPLVNLADSGKLVDKAIHALFEQCKQEEFKRMKELNQNLEQEVKLRHPDEYGNWKNKEEQTVTALLKSHGAEKSTFCLALISLILSPFALMQAVPVSFLFLGFAWETTRDEFHFLRGILEAVGLMFVAFLIGEPLGIFPMYLYKLIVTAAIILGSLWFLKCGQSGMKYKKLYKELIPYSHNVIQPLNDAIRAELAAEYETVTGVDAQLEKWSKWYQWGG